MNALKRVGTVVVTLIVLYAVGYQGIWRWGICRKWVPKGESLLVTRKTGQIAGKDQYADEGQQGVVQELLGPGRHFLNPYTYSVTRIRDLEIPPGEIRLVVNKIGKDLPKDSGRFLANPDEKGTQRKVLTPGTYRINTYGQSVEKDKRDPKSWQATMIEPGYVGVQTLREGVDMGVLDTVLQSGYYNINPKEIRVDKVEIGYRVLDFHVEYENTAEGRRKKPGSGISFPLADGKQMHLDMTVVWGLYPEDAPRIISQYGDVSEVERKIIEPQVLSICKNEGSNLTTQQFIEGATRERFQQKVTESLQEIGKQKGMHFLIALVRGFHPAEDITETIQAQMVAEEEKLTLKTEQERDTVAARLEEARRKVDIAVTDFDAETQALVEEERAQGMKKAAETRAEAERIVAELRKRAAEIDAEIVKIKGQAQADVIEAQKKAEATRLKLFVDAFGGADIYNMATFAELLLDSDVQIEYRYAGPGTLWTDSGRKGEETRKALQDLATKKILERATSDKTNAPVKAPLRPSE